LLVLSLSLPILDQVRRQYGSGIDPLHKEMIRMNPTDPLLSRRHLLQGGLALGAVAFFAPGVVFAEELARTPRLTEGPFYPRRLPLDTDNDLIIINKSLTPAVGTITHLSGRVLSLAGEPINNATVEIWQCDNLGHYLAEGSRARSDPNFQGFGRFTTGTKGEYRFRTIKPVPYPGRTPHIHVKVKKGDRELLTTQLFINGHAQNRRDGVLRGLRDPFDRELVLVDFKPIKDSKIGECSATFDIVVGLTPAERPRDRRK
jgi:protocatechuate 3,4-dioxygenase beta subunit